jgi:hypothetical protein
MFWKHKKRKKRKHPAGERVAVAHALLVPLHQSSDACPPLKSAVGGLIAIIEMIEVCSFPFCSTHVLIAGS